MKDIIFKDDMMSVNADSNSCLYHEVEVRSEAEGELDSITIDKTTGKILIRFKKFNEESHFDDSGECIPNLDKDKGFKLNIIEN